MCSHAIVDGVDCFSVDELVAEIGSEEFIEKEEMYQTQPRGQQCLCGVDLRKTAQKAGYSVDLREPSIYVLSSK